MGHLKAINIQGPHNGLPMGHPRAIIIQGPHKGTQRPPEGQPRATNGASEGHQHPRATQGATIGHPRATRGPPTGHLRAINTQKPHSRPPVGHLRATQAPRRTHTWCRCRRCLP